MVDFRKRISPKARREHRGQSDAIVAFQEMDNKGKAAALLRASRILVDADVIEINADWKAKDWGLSALVTQVALVLDPDATVSDEERASLRYDLGERSGQERFCDMANISLSNMDLFWAKRHGGEVQDAADFLMEDRLDASALAVGVDTIFPGTFPARKKADTRPDLPGLYVIGRDGDGGRDAVLLYSDDHDRAWTAFRAARAANGDEGQDVDKDLVQKMRRSAALVGLRLGSLSSIDIEIQTFNGEVLDSWAQAQPEENAPSM